MPLDCTPNAGEQARGRAGFAALLRSGRYVQAHKPQLVALDDGRFRTCAIYVWLHAHGFLQPTQSGATHYFDAASPLSIFSQLTGLDPVAIFTDNDNGLSFAAIADNVDAGQYREEYREEVCS